MNKSYYELLGLSQSADAKALRKAFLRLSKKLHPDTTVLPVDEAANKFRKVYEAYELLSDPLKRKLYDLELEEKSFKGKPTFNENKSKASLNKLSFIDARRPFSGGELFSLLLLCIALLMSMFLGIGFALVNGRDLQFRPSWLVLNQSSHIITPIEITNDTITLRNNSFKSALYICD